jgi:hypothetical protein
MKILCFTPLHPDYGIKQAALDGIMALEHDDVLERVFSANDNPFDEPYENIAYQHNKARSMVLQGGYDALLSIEADMIIPPDAIGKLIDANADISYGLYVWRHKKARWNAYKTVDLWGGESVSLDHTGEDARAAWGKVIDVAGLGMGCTLISRDTLKRLRFRLHDGSHSWIEEEHARDFERLRIDPRRERKGMVCDDWLLAMDAQHYGFTQRADCGLICGHITDEGILWPDVDDKRLYRLEVQGEM